MKPPDHIIKELERMHPWARFGWWVPNDGNPEGVFSLIQLYHVRDMERAILVQPWNRRGPIYGSFYDSITRVPMWIRDIDPRDVFSGAIFTLIREWMRPMKDRAQESSKEAWDQFDREMTDHAESMGDFVWHHSKKTGSSPGITARKFVSKEKQAILAGDYDKEVAKNIVETPTPKGAVAMK